MNQKNISWLRKLIQIDCNQVSILYISNIFMTYRRCAIVIIYPNSLNSCDWIEQIGRMFHDIKSWHKLVKIPITVLISDIDIITLKLLSLLCFHASDEKLGFNHEIVNVNHYFHMLCTFHFHQLKIQIKVLHAMFHVPIMTSFVVNFCGVITHNHIIKQNTSECLVLPFVPGDHPILWADQEILKGLGFNISGLIFTKSQSGREGMLHF